MLAEIVATRQLLWWHSLFFLTWTFQLFLMWCNFGQDLPSILFVGSLDCLPLIVYFTGAETNFYFNCPENIKVSDLKIFFTPVGLKRIQASVFIERFLVIFKYQQVSNWLIGFNGTSTFEGYFISGLVHTHTRVRTSTTYIL